MNFKQLSAFFLFSILVSPCIGTDAEENKTNSHKRERVEEQDLSNQDLKRIKLESQTADHSYDMAVLYENENKLGKALPLYNLAAEQGHAEAKNCLQRIFEAASLNNSRKDEYIMGAMYENGWGVPKDLIVAALLYRNVSGKASCGNGIIVPYCFQSFVDAANFFKERADLGNPDAQYSLGILYEAGACESGAVTTSLTSHHPCRLLALAAAQGHHIAPSHLTDLVNWYRESRSDFELNKLATCYENGWGVNQDLKEAVRLYNLLINDGNDLDSDGAKYALGRLYEEGKGVDQDFVEAHRLYTSVTNSSHWSLKSLALYILDISVTNSSYRSLKSLALYRLGVLHENGWGVDQDYAEAARLYDLAASSDPHHIPRYDTAESQYALGVLCEENKVSVYGIIDAAKLFNLAATQGHEDALSRLTAICRKYHERAQKGEAEAQYVLGKLYEHGYGVYQDLYIAGMYFRRAAEQKHGNAIFNIKVDDGIDYFSFADPEIWKLIFLQLDRRLNMRLVCKGFCSVFDGSITRLSPTEEKLEKIGGIQGFSASIQKKGLFSNLTELCFSNLQKTTINQESDINDLFSLIDTLNIKHLGFQSIDFPELFYKNLEKNKTITSLELAEGEMNPSVCKMFSQSLMNNTTITSVSVSCNECKENGDGRELYKHFIYALADVLNRNQTITSLFVTPGNITSYIPMNGFTQITSSLNKNETLRSFGMRNVMENDDKTWKSPLGNYLQSNKTLTSLDLTCNSVNDDGAAIIADALRKNRTLTSLNLNSNQITNDGARMIAEALKSNTTVTELELDQANLFEDDYISGDLHREINDLLARNKKYKGL